MSADTVLAPHSVWLSDVLPIVREVDALFLSVTQDGSLWPWVLLALPCVTTALVVVNLISWRPLRRQEQRPSSARLSVLVPARNEQNNIGPCLQSILACTHGSRTEVLVYNDRSTDRSAEIVRDIASRHSQLRLLEGGPLPSGWNGKSHACHQLASQASGDIFIFIDADVRLQADALEALAQRFERDTALGILTALPRQVVATWTEQLIVPLLHVTYLSWLWLPLIRWLKDPRILAANGQILAVRRSAYESIGGFEAVRHAVVDDMAFCRQAKVSGVPVAFVDASNLANCRMYQSAQGVWEGFSKNLYAGLGARPAALLTIACLYIATYIAPFVACLAAPWWPSLELPASLAVVLLVGSRLLIAQRYHHPLWTVPALPLAVCGLLLIALNSFLWFRRGDVRWRGRRYQPTLQGIAVTGTAGLRSRS